MLLSKWHKGVRFVCLFLSFFYFIFNHTTDLLEGHAVAQFVEALRYKPKGRGVRFPMVSLDFFH